MPQPCSSIALCKPRLCHYTDSSEAICRLQVESIWNGLKPRSRENAHPGRTTWGWLFILLELILLEWKLCLVSNTLHLRLPAWGFSSKWDRTAFFLERLGHGLKLPILILKSTRPFRNGFSHLFWPPAPQEPWISLLTLRRLHWSGTKSFKVSSPDLMQFHLLFGFFNFRVERQNRTCKNSLITAFSCRGLDHCFSLSRFLFLAICNNFYWCQFIKDTSVIFKTVFIGSLSSLNVSVWVSPTKIGTNFPFLLLHCIQVSPEFYRAYQNLKSCWSGRHLNWPGIGPEA